MIDARKDAALLAHKRRIDAARKQAALAKRGQRTLRNLTPGVATPLTVMREMQARRAER